MPSVSKHFLIFFLISALTLTACSKGPSPISSGDQTHTHVVAPTPDTMPESPDTSADHGWQVSSGEQDVLAGDLEGSGLLVHIPAGSFDQQTALVVAPVEETPVVPAEQMTLSGAVEVSAGEPVRLNQPTTITFQVNDPADLQAMAEGGLWAAYYNGEAWEYFPPDVVDLEAGTLSFETFHFSLQGYGQINIQERLNQYAHSQAVSSFVQSNLMDASVNQLVSQTVDHLLTERLKISDESLKAKVISSLVNDDAWGSMVQQLRDGNVTDFVKTLNVFAGQKIVENVDASLLASSLETVSNDTAVEFTESAAQAAAYLVEGQPKEAARILGEKIADQFLVTTLAKGAVEVVQHQIDVWKDAEIEAAFQAYKNGTSGYFWGYNVDPLQFDDLYNQMRGIAVRLEQEAVQREIQRREEMSMRPATDEELNAVRERAKADLKQQFEQRIQQEADLAQREQQTQDLIARMQAANLLEKNRFGFDPAYDTLETRLDKLFHLAKKILRDTGRSSWTSGTFTTEKVISSAEMAILMQAWYSGGRDQYESEIFKRYGIRLLPACRWEFVETKAYLSDGSGRFSINFDGANQVTTAYPFEGALSCEMLTFNTIHTWTEPPKVLVPGDTLNFSVATSWSLDGDPGCSGLTAGVKTSMQIITFTVSAGNSHIPTSAEPEGSVSADGDWVVVNGEPGNRIEIVAFPDGGGVGGTVRYYYNFVCEGD